MRACPSVPMGPCNVCYQRLNGSVGHAARRGAARRAQL